MSCSSSRLPWAGPAAGRGTRLNQVDATYRSELGELNEHNFAKFEAALERRIGQAESRLVRWTFALWAPTALAMVSLMIAVLLKL